VDVSDTALRWDAQALEQRLQADLPGMQVQALAEVDSTNTRILDALRSGCRHPLLVVAEAQTRGRGRNGRPWQSVPGASLTFSLGLPFAPADWSGLSLAVGVALADAIEPAPAGPLPRVQLKWPNDLWLADPPVPAPAEGRWRKLSGTLIETAATAAGARACVVGIGINVRPVLDLHGLGSGYACVQELEPGLDAPALLARVAPAVMQALCRFERDGLSPFATAFARRDLLCGRAVATTQAGLPQGVADGVDAQGALRVRHAGGVALLSSGEVSVRFVALVEA
jgi:BirA family transcriptional regulator, biotin operon repressor / biotin---[acetyl-CoA-carboxylase] ligase